MYFLFLTSEFTFAQLDKSRFIGEWTCIKEEYSNEVDFTELAEDTLMKGLEIKNDSLKTVPDFRLIFKPKSKLTYYSLGVKYRSKYTISNSELSIGGQIWQIESLSDNIGYQLRQAITPRK